MHRQWHPSQGYTAAPRTYPRTQDEPLGLLQSSEESWLLEEARRIARVADERLAAAEHRFNRETEQLHTTIAAYEHSYQTLLRQHRDLRGEFDRLREQNEQLRLESEQTRTRSQQRIADVEKQARLRIADAEKRSGQRTADEKKLIAANQRLSNLVRMLRFDHETSELVVNDLDHRCDELSMNRADLQEVVEHQALQINGLNKELDDVLIRNTHLENERENHLLQLDLMQSRLEDAASSQKDEDESLALLQESLRQTQQELDEQRATNRTLQSSLQHHEAVAAIALNESGMEQESELQRLQDELNADWQRRYDQIESELVRSRYQCNEQNKQLQAQASLFLQQVSGLKRARDLALQNSQAQSQRCDELAAELRRLRNPSDDHADDSEIRRAA